MMYCRRGLFFFFQMIFITINLKAFLFPNNHAKDEILTEAAAPTSTGMERLTDFSLDL